MTAAASLSRGHSFVAGRGSLCFNRLLVQHVFLESLQGSEIEEEVNEEEGDEEGEGVKGRFLRTKGVWIMGASGNTESASSVREDIFSLSSKEE
jgi:hypothetical protein